MKKTIIWFATCSAALLILFCGIGTLKAGVEARNRGKIFILKKRPPSYFNSQGAFASFLRNNSIKNVPANEDNEWILRTFAFLKRKLGDYEVHMAFYNVDRGKSKNARVFVDTFPQMTQDRNTKTIVGKAKLTRPQFDANIEYMVVAQNGSAELAKGYFTLLGPTNRELDNQKRMENTQREMEKSMKDLEARAKQQEEDEKLRSQGIDPEERRRQQRIAERKAKEEAETPEKGPEEQSDDEKLPGEVDQGASPRGCGCQIPTAAGSSPLLDMFIATF